MSVMDEDPYKHVRHIAIRSKRLRDRVEKDVLEVCKLLKKLNDECSSTENKDLPKTLKDTLRKHFRDICWSLKLHLLFHLGIGESKADSKLQEVVHLTDEDMSELPDQKHAIDPGSKLMEIVSIGTAEVR